MEIYVDVIIAENFIINLFLLLVSTKLLKYQYGNISMYLSSLIGAIYTLVLFSEVKFLSSLVFKILVAMIMITIVIRPKRVANIIKGTIVFFINSFMLCGLCFGLVMMQNTYVLGDSFNINNYSIKWVLLALMIFYILLVRVNDYLKDRAVINNFIYDIYINIGGKILILKGFLDTGNELREVVSNLPCIIIEDKYLKEIDIKENDKYIINYNTITESGQLEGIRGDKIMIRNSLSDEWKKIDAIICKSSMVLSKDNDYQALLSRGII